MIVTSPKSPPANISKIERTIAACSSLMTSAAGAIGSRVLATLAQKGVTVHALTRSPEKAKFPPGVMPVKGDLMDIDATEAAIAKASTLFLLNAVTPDELTRRCSR